MSDTRVSGAPEGSPAIPRVTLFDLALWPTLAFAYLITLMKVGGLDQRVSDFFVGRAHRGFPLKDGFWTSSVLHDGGRTVMIAAGILILLGLLASLILHRWRRYRRVLAFLCTAVLLSVALVNLGKDLTNMDCPWDLTRYGGSRPYFGLFDDKPDYLPRGRCFPGGHSSAGFALFGLYFAAIQLGLRRHRWYLLPALMVGGLFALDQWVRGAHFPSHDLTTAYICWMTTLVTYGRFFHDSGQSDQ